MKINVFFVSVMALAMMASCTGRSAALKVTAPVEGCDTVSQAVMQQVYDEVQTSFKYGLVLAPADNFHKYDCPTVFRADGKWYMSYLCYDGRKNKDGRGYETWLAESDDLLHWKTLGRLLSFRDEGWDANQRGGYVDLEDIEWGGSYEVGQYDGKYWITYIGGDKRGYETTPLSIGAAWTDGGLTAAHEWNGFEQPILSPSDSLAQWWETITQYKSLVYRTPEKFRGTFGGDFMLFYNAAGINPSNGVKAERIGMAFSDDMVHWSRYEGNPVFGHENGMITGDAHIQQMGDLYVMFFFGAYWKNRPYHAFNTFACSYDLVHWTEWSGDDLIYPTEGFDDEYAHKSFLIKNKGVVYHFYCAVDKAQQRGIAVATSCDLGRSEVHFPAPEPK